MSALAGNHCNPRSLRWNCHFGYGPPDRFPLLSYICSPLRVVGQAQLLISDDFGSSQSGPDLDIEPTVVWVWHFCFLPIALCFDMFSTFLEELRWDCLVAFRSFECSRLGDSGAMHQGTASFFTSSGILCPLVYPLVNIQETMDNRRITSFIVKSTINGHFQYLCWITRGYYWWTYRSLMELE